MPLTQVTQEEWNKLTNIKGPRGIQGPEGPQGIAGIGTPRIFYNSTLGEHVYRTPPDVRAILVEVVGGGGAGYAGGSVWERGQAGKSAAGGGGGAGAYVAWMYPSLPSQTWGWPPNMGWELEAEYPYYVGDGSKGGHYEVAQTSWFGPVDWRWQFFGAWGPEPHTIEARGGGGGGWLPNYLSTPETATGGGGGGPIPFGTNLPHAFGERGQNGGPAIRIGGEACVSGRGADSHISHGGGPPRFPLSWKPGGVGEDASGYGCGGSGGVAWGDQNISDPPLGTGETHWKPEPGWQFYRGGLGFRGVVKITEYV